MSSRMHSSFCVLVLSIALLFTGSTGLVAQGPPGGGGGGGGGSSCPCGDCSGVQFLPCCGVVLANFDGKWVQKFDANGDPIFDEFDFTIELFQGGWDGLDPYIDKVVWKDVNDPAKTGDFNPTVPTGVGSATTNVNLGVNTSGMVAYNIIFKDLATGDIIDCDCTDLLCWEGFVSWATPSSPGIIYFPEPPVTCPCETCGDPDPCGPGAVAGKTKFIPNIAFRRHLPRIDWVSGGVSLPGCGSCGGFGGTGTVLPTIRFRRMLIPSNPFEYANGGRYWFFDFDYRLKFIEDNGDFIAVFFDPESHRAFTYTDGLNGSNPNGTYETEEDSYFCGDFTLVDGSGGTVGSSPILATIEEGGTIKTTVKRRNGCSYHFDIMYGGGDVSEGRLTKISTPQGFEINFDYKTFDEQLVMASPTLQLQLERIYDQNDNQATINYHPTQMAGLWCISDITINEENGDFLNKLTYEYNTDGLLSIVSCQHGSTATPEIMSTYTYGEDTLWQANTITWNERTWTSGRNDTLYTSKDFYVQNDGSLVNQFTNVMLGRSNGAGDRYMAISHSSVTSGLHRIFYRGQLIEWAQGVYYRYFTSWTQDPNISGFDSYSGTMETVYAHHPNITTQQAIDAEPPELVSETGLSCDQLYDTLGNPTRTDFPDSTYELFDYDSNNQVIYYRDRDGYVTLTDRDSYGNITRIARGLKDVSGPGSEVAEPEATQEIFGYYPLGDPHEHMLKWSAVNDYQQGAFTEPSANERTDYIYQGLSAQITPGNLNRLIKVIKPLPEGQSSRPEVEFQWHFGRLVRMINERDQITHYNYDELGRLNETVHPDSSTEQVWYDDVNSSVYRKDRNGVVSLAIYDSSGRISYSYDAYGHDADLLDGQLDVIHGSEHDKTITSYSYLPNENTPYQVRRNSKDTIYARDYRGRVISEKQHPNNSIIRERTTDYVDNLVFKTEETFGTYTRREYVGYSADQQTVRKIACRTSATTFADNAAVLNATRITGADPDFTVQDAVRDIRGNLVQIFDEYGTETRNEFDALGRQTKTTRAFGLPIALTSETSYNAEGNVTETIDPTGMVTKIEYDPAGNVKTRTVGFGATDATPLVSSYTYHIDGKQKTETLPSTGIIETFYDDCCGKYRGIEDAEGGQRITVADSGGRAVYQATLDGFQFGTDNFLDPDAADTLGETTTRYRDDGRVQFRTIWKSARGLIDPANPPIAGMDGVPATDGVTTQYLYYSKLVPGLNILQQTIDTLGGGTSTVDIQPAYDKLKESIANGGAATVFSRGKNGSASVVISPDEKTMSVTILDGMGRTAMTATMSGPAAGTPNQLLDWNCAQYDQVYTLASFGDVEQTLQIDPDGNYASSLVDGYGRGVGQLDQDQNLTQTKFDPAGNPLERISTVNQVNLTTSYVYDSLGRQTETTNPMSHTTKTNYNASTGRVDSREDAKQQLTSYTYDTLGRVLTTTDRLSKVTTQTYDSAGRLDTITDAENEITAYDYDLMGRKTSTVYSDASSFTNQYDKAGRLTVQKANSGKTRTNVYEFSGVLDKIEYRDTETGAVVSTDDFSYDNYLRRSGSASTDGVVRALTYTDRGQLDTDTTIYSSKSYVVDYDYDSRGRLNKVTYPSGRAVEYTFTNRNELDLIKWDGSQIEDRDYDELGRLTDVDRAFTDEVRAYDNANRLTSISNTNVGTATYGYDNNNNKLSETWTGTLSAYNFTTQNTGTYPSGYDAEDRFRNFIQSGQSKDYELVRNDIGVITNRKLNSADQLRTHSAVYETTAIGSNSQVYDTDGQLTSTHTGITLGWNHAGRMTQAVVPAAATAGIEGTHDYGYDGDGKRVWKKVNPTGGTLDHKVFIYAGPNRVADYAAGADATSPDQEYVYAREIDSLVMLVRNGGNQKLTVTRNQQWSVSALADASNGNVVEYYSYDVFGQRTILDGTGTVISASAYDNPFGYTSREHDTETDLMYFRARYYDPTNGEFLSPDPLEYVDGLSRYPSYLCLNDVDPLGLEITKCRCYFLNDHRIPGWQVFTTEGDCQKACCSNKPDNSKRCQGYKSPLTPDETGAVGLCNAIPLNVDNDNDGVPDRIECEKSITQLMNIVISTSNQKFYEHKLCFAYSARVFDKCQCTKSGDTLILDGRCTVTFYYGTPNPKAPGVVGYWKPTGEFDANGRKVRKIRYWKWTGFRAGYWKHSWAKVCCGPVGKQTCMYFDVGSQNRAGHFGGDDHWFPIDDKRFGGEIDPTSITPDDVTK